MMNYDKLGVWWQVTPWGNSTDIVFDPSDSVVFGSDELDKMKQENETEPLLVKETKFHTVPSISGADSCLLLDMKEKAECTDWNVR